MRGVLIQQFGGPEVLKLVELPDLSPKADQVLIEVKAAGVNPKDTQYRAGIYPHLHSPPFTPGIDGAGIINRIGSGVKHLKVGDRVFFTRSITGSYAEFTLCSKLHVHPLPQGYSFAQGAAIGVPYTTAFRALFQKAKILPGETLFIDGATGAVGIAALQFARACGVRIIGCAGSEKGLQFLRKEGADIAISYKEKDFQRKILEKNGGEKVDVILEMNANLNLELSLEMLGKHGRLVVVGGVGKTEINPVYLKENESSILSVSLLVAPEEEVRQVYEGIKVALDKKIIMPVIQVELPLKEVHKAHHLLGQPGHIGKIILIP